MFIVISFIVVFCALLSWAWVKGISHTKENHPDYKGDDFLSTSAGRDLWDEYDENNTYYEGNF
jgi:hypothetical protein